MLVGEEATQSRGSMYVVLAQSGSSVVEDEIAMWQHRRLNVATTYVYEHTNVPREVIILMFSLPYVM